MAISMVASISGYNVIIGWFAGSIYDEALSLPVGLVLYRLYSVLVLLILGVLVQSIRTGFKAKFFKFLGFLYTGTHFFNVPEPLINWSVKSELGSSLETEHFVVYFDPKDISNWMKSLYFKTWI